MKLFTLPRIVLAAMFLFLMMACSHENAGYQGYIESNLRYMASNFSGILTKLHVNYGDTVKQSQLLYTLEQWPEESSYKESLAQMAVTKVNIDKLSRQLALIKSKIEKQNPDYTNLLAQLEITKANLNQNITEMETTSWKKEFKSWVNGSVFDIFYQEGEFVPPGRPVLSLLVPQDIKIIFFVPEAAIGKIRMHQPVIANCDGCPNPIQARISFISPKAEFTPPIIYSSETKSKLIFMVEALPIYETGKHLHSGQPVTVKFQEEKR